MNEPLNIAELEAWYRQQIKEQAKKAKSQKRQLFFVIKFYMWVVIGVLSLAILFLFVGLFSEHSNSMETAIIILFSTLLSFGGIAFFVYALSVGKLKSFETLRKTGTISPFKNLTNSVLDKIINELADEMQIERSRISVWKILSQQAYPSIEQDEDDTVHLVIPPHFFLTAQNNRSKAKAILAHELGHILQSDSKLFLVTETYYSIIRKIFIPLIVVGIVFRIYLIIAAPAQGSLANTTPFYLGFIFDAAEIIFLVAGFEGIIEARKKSELLADTAAILYTRDKSIISVLEELADTRSNSIHPDKKTRISHAENIFLEYNLKLYEESAI